MPAPENAMTPLCVPALVHMLVEEPNRGFIHEGP